MARLQLSLPQEFIFTTEIAVRVSDLNYGGHVGNDRMLSFMQEARTQFYRSLGFQDETSIEGTIGQIVTDAAVQYKAESFLGDVLIMQVAVADVTTFGFDMFYRVTHQVTGKEVALGKTGIVCFDYAKRKVAAIPSTLLSTIGHEPKKI